MDEKLRFVASYLELEEVSSMTELCASFGISRQTGYALVRRYRADGFRGLEPRSRAPLTHPQGLDPAVSARIVALRRAHPFWGPRKLKAHLGRLDATTAWPAASTIGDLLRREGLSEPRRRRRTAVPVTRPFQAVNEPNDTWCIDFKGWFRTRDGTRCDPLTLSDACSRYIFVNRIMAPTREEVEPAVERVMREHGLPKAMRSDNGPPFASSGAGGLSRLSVGWLKLGIVLERIEPGCPQQNGRHERMHKTLKEETTLPASADAAEQQSRFDAFRFEFNQLRPHEALGQETPASRHRPSPRPYPARIEEPWYDADHEVRRVRSNGEIKWRGAFVFVSEALAGEPIGLAETEDGHVILRFAGVDLGLIEHGTTTLRRFAPARPCRREAARQTPTQTEPVNHVAGP